MDEADDCSELEDSAEEEVSELELAVSDEEDSEDELASPAGRLDELSLACPAVLCPSVASGEGGASSEGWDDDSDEEIFCSDETEEIDEDDETDEAETDDEAGDIFNS